MNQRDLFADLDTPSGEQLRDEGIERVSSNNSVWLAACVRAFSSWARSLPSSREVIGEDVRVVCCLSGCGNPTHHNAWGALVSALVRDGLLQPLGKIRKMRDPRSHARKSPVYLVGIGAAIGKR